MNEILASLEKTTALKWEIQHVKTEDMIAEGQRMLAEGDFMGIANSAKAINFSPGYRADFKAGSFWGMRCWGWRRRIWIR
jgi:hypothetical protein